jgi:hypothetical protein
MTDSPVIFRPIADGRQAVMLHLVQVGEIGSCDFGAMSYWRLYLPGCGSGFGRAGSLKAAGEYVTSKVEQWIDAAGLVPPPAPDIRAFRPDDWGKIKQAVRP